MEVTLKLGNGSAPQRSHHLPGLAAVNIDTGTFMAQCKSKHRSQKFIKFLNYIDKQIPEDLDGHLIVDNNATHKPAEVRQWLAPRRRYHVHYMPTYPSRLHLDRQAVDTTTCPSSLYIL